METRKLHSYDYFMYIKCSTFVDYACFIDNRLDYFVNGSNLREETTNKVYFYFDHSIPSILLNNLFHQSLCSCISVYSKVGKILNLE